MITNENKKLARLAIVLVLAASRVTSLPFYSSSILCAVCSSSWPLATRWDMCPSSTSWCGAYLFHGLLMAVQALTHMDMDIPYEADPRPLCLSLATRCEKGMCTLETDGHLAVRCHV